jgi:2,3-bisphosphoglycerate-independent phosphoglycerate mutase
MQCILIIGDGMADQPLQELNFKTPIEAANPKAMNHLAQQGVSGLLDPIAPNVVPDSDTANLTLLGYEPNLVCEGRGAFEAAGAGLQVKQNDVAFRCNFVTVDAKLHLIDERAGRIGVEAKILGETIEQIQLKIHSDVEVHFKQAMGFKAALVLRGDGLSSKVTEVLPKTGYPVAKITPLDNSFEAKHTADVLNEFVQLTNQALKFHPINEKRKSINQRPANAVLPWSGSRKPNIVPFQEKYGLRASCVAAASLIKGIGKFSGMDVPIVEGATGEFDTDTLAKADAVLAAFNGGGSDFVYVHVEAADEASHDGDVAGKIAVIQKIDTLIDRVLKGVDLSDTVIVLTSDHVTSCKTRTHTSDAVPVCFAGANIVSDDVTVYSERSVYKGGLKRISGKDIMPMVLKYMNKNVENRGENI